MVLTSAELQEQFNKLRKNKIELCNHINKIHCDNVISSETTTMHHTLIGGNAVWTWPRQRNDGAWPQPHTVSLLISP